MKIYLKKLSYLLLSLTLLLGACDAEESLTITNPAPEFVLNTPGISTIFLNFEVPENPAFTINWVDEVNATATYNVEMSTDAAFTNPISLGTTDRDNFSMTVAAFNDVLNAADVKSFSATAVYMRINTGSVLSNTILFQVSKFAVEVPIITSPNTADAFVLSDVDPDLVIATITWEDPEITATSTVEVSYELEAAEAGTNFANAFSLGETQENSIDLTHGQLNSYALDNSGVAGTAINFDFRIKAIAKTAAGDLFRSSDGITLSITPYDVALPPALYVVGAGAVDAGWGWDSPVELLLQGKKWSGNINLSPDNGGNFRFFTDKSLEWGSPSYNFPYFKDRGYTIDANFEDANDGDNNFLFTGAAGSYFIEIDTEAETITLGPAVVGPSCNFDQLWVVGAGAVDAGWGWASPVEISCTGTGVYQGNINLTNDAFRFFSDRALEWGSPSFNYPYYADAGYTIDANFENAADGDQNFRFVGTPGTYFLSIDDINKTITLGPEQSLCEFDQLWLVGGGVPDAGWGWDSPVALPCTGAGVYSGDVTFANDAFRFFTDRTLEWGSPSYNYPYYEGEGYTIDANFQNAADGDQNFSFVGTPGTYTLTIDTVNKTITLN
ncbi:SusE domain-containing protein [Polaribacter litorisediminis]|uniref:SusE domain-containing protein n=1 Tax=Polaribacter litorisediminis TaxID=1908341 RepID=UPI001CBA9D6D|nr:SusE domain-containing protein [Polaribacter litorisediminis]UAM99156.1 SusE domain-containing protein [Polaribacter litorisediminis]